MYNELLINNPTPTEHIAETQTWEDSASTFIELGRNINTRDERKNYVRELYSKMKETVLPAQHDKTEQEYREDIDHMLMAFSTIYRELVMPVGSDRYKYIADIADRVQRAGENSTIEPESIICIPFALANEQEGSILRTLESLAKQDNAGSQDILLYANYIWDDNNEATQQKANTIFELAKSKYPNLRISMVTQGYEPGELSMTRIRQDYMDLVIMDATNMDLSPRTPVIWVDADTLSMSKKSVESIAQSVRSMEAAFVHADLRYTPEDYHLGHGFDKTRPEDIFAIDEIARRMKKRELRGIDNGYPEESGLGFAVGTYTLIGVMGEGTSKSHTIFHQPRREGFTPLDPKRGPMNESAYLIADFAGIPLDVTAQMYPYTRNIRGKIPRQMYSCYVKDIKGARLYTSARRQVASVAAMQDAEYSMVRNNYSLKEGGDFSQEAYRTTGRLEAIPPAIGGILLEESLRHHLGYDVVPDASPSNSWSPIESERSYKADNKYANMKLEHKTKKLLERVS